jgi:hypothetical protein
MPDASRPYSIAVAPLSSVANCQIKLRTTQSFCVVTPPLLQKVMPERAPLTRCW